MSLAEYSRKRNFARTAEPRGREEIREGGNIFVVQEHHASHLHWDLRLEIDGVLKSWAVPKEPPTLPGVKRLAVQVEDHPLEYADFEGTIPEGEYGAGSVKIWDKGIYEIKERTEDKLLFALRGRKLKGDYCLVKFKRGGERNWLFFAIKTLSRRSAT